MSRSAGQSSGDHFRMILITVMGQALDAAGYTLEDAPVQWAGGRFRFVKSLNDELRGFIEFQLLSYVDSDWAAGMPSRFTVTLTRTDRMTPAEQSDHAGFAQRDLSALVVEDFGVAILPSAGHWWRFRTTEELGQALAEAGHLIVGYGLPWLAGELSPGDDATG